MNPRFCRLKPSLVSALVTLLCTSMAFAVTDPIPKKSKTKDSGKRTSSQVDTNALLDQVTALEKRVEELSRQVGETAGLKEQIDDLKGRLEIAEARVAGAEALRGNLPSETPNLSSSGSGLIATNTD